MSMILEYSKPYNCIQIICGGARGVMAIVVGKGHGDTSSNPGRNWLQAMGKIVGQSSFFSLGDTTSLGEAKLWIQTC